MRELYELWIQLVDWPTKGDTGTLRCHGTYDSTYAARKAARGLVSPGCIYEWKAIRFVETGKSQFQIDTRPVLCPVCRNIKGSGHEKFCTEKARHELNYYD